MSEGTHNAVQGDVNNLIIHVVHGTWPYGPLAKSPAKPSSKKPWFFEGSAFHQVLLEGLNVPFSWVPFHWSGENSFRARNTAAEELATQLTKYFNASPQAEHVLVCHSHGGSVAVNAARLLDERGQNHISKVITMASPFTRHKITQRTDAELIARYLIIRFWWIPAIMFLISIPIANILSQGETKISDIFPGIWLTIYVYSSIFSSAITLSTLFAFIFKIGIYKIRLPTRHWYLNDETNSKRNWNIYAIRAPRDEASIVINVGQNLSSIFDFFSRWVIFIPSSLLLKIFNLGLRKIFIMSLLISVLIMLYIFESKYFTGSNAYPNFFNLIISSYVISLYFLVSIIFAVSQIVFTFASLVGPVLLLPSYLFLAGTLGTDVLHGSGLLDVECESMPSGMSGEVSMISISEQDRNKLGLVHFIHETSAARVRVVEILGRKPH